MHEAKQPGSVWVCSASWGSALGLATLIGILPTTIGYLMAAGSIGGGAFAMWEARMGWCVVRALGIKTRL